MAELGSQLLITPTAGGLTLAGEIDAYTAPDLRDAIDELLNTSEDTSKNTAENTSTNTSTAVTLRMDHVTFMDSSGLRVIIAATDAARGQQVDLILAGPQPAVRRLIEITGLDGHLTVEAV